MATLNTRSNVGTLLLLSLALAGVSAHAAPSGGRSLRAEVLGRLDGYSGTGSDTGDRAADVAFVGDVALVAGYDAGVRLVSLADPRRPVEIGALLTPGTALGIAVDGPHAYVAAGSAGGMRVLDVRDPARPAEVGALVEPGMGKTTSIAVIANTVFLAEYATDNHGERTAGGLRVVDVTDPSRPETLSHLPDPVGYARLLVAGERIYAHNELGFDVWDVLVPEAPRALGGFRYWDEDPYLIRDAVVLEGELGVAVRGVCRTNIPLGQTECDGFMEVLDISDPNAPREVGRRTMGFPTKVDVVDGLVIVGDEGELLVFEVADRSHPELVGTLTDDEVTSGRIRPHGRILVMAQRSRPGAPLLTLRLGASVTGHVLDAVGRRMEGVEVELAESTRVDAITDERGYFALHRLYIGPIYTLLPSHPGYRFVPPSREVELDTDGMALTFTMIPAPASATLSGGASGVTTTLTITSTAGLLTRLTFAPDVVRATTVVTCTPRLAGGGPGMAFTGHAFDLEAVSGGADRQGDSAGDVAFDAPVTATVAYTPDEVGTVSDESALRLYRWGADGWQLSDATCPDGGREQRVDVTARTLVADLCRTGTYAVLGPTNGLCFPSVTRDRDRD